MAKGCHPLEVATEILEQADRSEPTVHAPVKIGEQVQVVQQGTIDVASILDEQAIVGADVRQPDRKLLTAAGLEFGLVEPERTAEDLAVEAAGPIVIVQPPAKLSIAIRLAVDGSDFPCRAATFRISAISLV
jgi:hypothetical protein